MRTPVCKCCVCAAVSARRGKEVQAISSVGTLPLDRVVSEGLSEEMTFKQTPEAKWPCKGVEHWGTWSKPLRCKLAQPVGKTVQRPVQPGGVVGAAVKQ